MNLVPYTGEVIKIRVRGITGISYRSDIAIDDLKFEDQNALSTNQNNLKQLGVDFYPNPADNYFNIINPERLELKEVLIYDLAGRLINKIELSNAEESEAINISKLEKAVYLIHIKGEEGEMVKKLIKE